MLDFNQKVTQLVFLARIKLNFSSYNKTIDYFKFASKTETARKKKTQQVEMQVCEAKARYKLVLI